MKKLILSVSAIAGLSLSGHSQGITFSDGTYSQDISINGAADTTQDVNLELLYLNGTTYTPVVTLLLSTANTATAGTLGQISSAAGDITATGSALGVGSILDGSGVGYLVPAGTQTFEVEGWTGAYSSYAAAEASGVTGVFAGVSASFTESVPTAPNSPTDISGIQEFNLAQVPTTIVPEPGTLAMAGVGLASMLFFRRRN